jgi:hypothetical protein
MCWWSTLVDRINVGDARGIEFSVIDGSSLSSIFSVAHDGNEADDGDGDDGIDSGEIFGEVVSLMVLSTGSHKEWHEEGVERFKSTMGKVNDDIDA